MVNIMDGWAHHYFYRFVLVSVLGMVQSVINAVICAHPRISIILPLQPHKAVSVTVDFLVTSVTVPPSLEIAAGRLLMRLLYHGSTPPNKETRDNLPSPWHGISCEEEQVLPGHIKSSTVQTNQTASCWVTLCNSQVDGAEPPHRWLGCSTAVGSASWSKRDVWTLSLYRRANINGKAECTRVQRHGFAHTMESQTVPEEPKKTRKPVAHRIEW